MTHPRGLWHPVFGHLFGIRPWEMEDLTPDELSALGSYVKKLGGKN